MDETISAESISAAKCKAEFLSRIDYVARTRSTLVVTKRGRPMVRIVPIEPENIEFFGALRDLVTYETSLSEPTDEHWDADA